MRTRVPGIRPRFRGSVAIVAGVLAGVGCVAYGGAAAAAPRPSISQVRQQVNTLTSEYDQADQQYDQALQNLSAAKSKLSRLNKQVANDRKSFDKMRGEVAQIAAMTYEDTGMTSAAALLASNNPQAVLSQASLMQQLAGSRNQQMKQFLAAARQLRASQQQASRAEQSLASLEKQKGQQRQHLASLLATKKAKLDSLTAAQQATVKSSTLGGGGVTVGVYSGPTSTAAEKAVAYDYSKLGDPYVFGATGPNAFDCSGLQQAAWASAGVSIPRTTYGQWAALPHIPSSAIQPGDLLFYDGEGHEAMYVGGGQIIDAPQTGQNVEKVPMNSTWFAQNFDGAARP